MEPPSTYQISIVNEQGWRIASDRLRVAIATALELQDAEESEVCLLLTDDAEIADLNRRFRRVAEPTDVLTFPAGDAASGDIAISVPYAERQAAVRGVSLDQEMGYLAIHGALHLCGLDDETEVDRAEMVAEMNRVAVQAGFEPDEAWASLLHDLAAHQDQENGEEA